MNTVKYSCDPPSFPTRRSSDLERTNGVRSRMDSPNSKIALPMKFFASSPMMVMTMTAIKSPKDRKSTRLNSSHVEKSYADFCLKKKILYNGYECLIYIPRCFPV